MNTKRTVFLISGPPGAGKSTLADKLCKSMDGLCVHIEGDLLYNLVKKGWVHPCDDHDNFFLNVLWDNIISLVENFTNNNMNVVSDYVFSIEQIFSVIDRIKNLDINIKIIVIKSDINILINRDRQRSGIAYVGEERIRQIVEDFNLNKFPERLILDNNDADLGDLVNIILNEGRFTVN
ncbi:AAA family ATPase [Solibacillus cecembensis]|uniref:AAA family ATPase n=1 Tax=Solibacillus cecembensis TaxID=459347 RepID=UPI003CFDDC28